MSTDFPQATADVNMDVRWNGVSPVIVLDGSADLRNKDELQRFLLEVHADVLRTGGRRVTVDVRSLDFMSSSCIKAFVTWLVQIQSAPSEQQYRVHFLFDRSRGWQKRTLTALSCFACELVGLSESEPA
jgi:hypothetical protein